MAGSYTQRRKYHPPVPTLRIPDLPAS